MLSAQIETMLTARDLLYKALDYDGFWNTSKRIKNSPPSKSRKSQLDKLLKVFGITKSNVRAQTQIPREEGEEDVTVLAFYSTSGSPKSMSRIEYIKSLTNFQYFSRGEFIADIDVAEYHELEGQIISTAQPIFPEQSKIISTGQVNLVLLFSGLYNFRLSIYHMFKYNFGKKTTYKFSLEDDYSLHLRMNFIKSMTDNLSEVDEVLCMLIDPKKRTFSEEEIEYPDVDLEALDEEWRSGFFK